METMLVALIADVFSIAGNFYSKDWNTKYCIEQIEELVTELDVTFTDSSKEGLTQHLDALLNCEEASKDIVEHLF